MTVPTSAHLTFSQVHIREDVRDEIYDVSPSETPLLSMAKHVTVENTLFQWTTDVLASPSDRKALQGDDAPQSSVTAPVLLNNRTQIATLDARVSGTGRSVKLAGRGDDLDYIIARRKLELKTGMDTTLHTNKPKVTGDSTTEPETAGIGAWITTNDVFASDGGSPTAATGVDARTDGTQRAFTEDDLRTTLLNCWTNGGKPDYLITGGFNRQIASTFGTGRTNVQKAEDSVLHASFDVYESDFGSLKIVPSRQCRARDALVLQMDMWGVAFLPGRNMAEFQIAKTGDSDAIQVLSEFGLISYNEKASGGVFDLTTS